MTKLKIIALLTGTLMILLTLAYIFWDSFITSKGINVPCAVNDSVNITGHHKFPNGSYSYEGLIIPAHLYKVFTFTTNDFWQEIPADPHVRGCICKLKPCLKFCCPRTEIYFNSSCVPFNSSNAYPSKILTTSNNELRGVDVNKEFAIQYGRACDNNMYHLVPWEEGYNYSLFENGTLYRWFDKRFLSKDEFCLNPYTVDETVILLPMNCIANNNKSEDTKIKIFGWVMLFSVPFMVLTMIVYMAVPELRTLHGKSLCCYLLGLCCGFLILAALNLKPFGTPSKFECKLFGFIAYFSLMASFLWLSVIAFDLFYNIRSPGGRHNENKRFIFYSIYAWGLALMFLGITYLAKESSLIPNHWKPAIATDEYCWFNVTSGWSAMIYFYSPIVIIISFNIVMFILTALQIHRVQKEMNDVTKNDESQKKIRTEREKFQIFLRLFIIMGVSWSIEIISYMVGSNSPLSKLFYFIDMINCTEGYLICALFVWKKKVKIYITNRYLPQSCSQRHRQSSSNKTTSSNINLPLNDTQANKMIRNKTVEAQS